MFGKSNLITVSVDDLLRHQEGPTRKKRRISKFKGSGSENEGWESCSSSRRLNESGREEDEERKDFSDDDEEVHEHDEINTSDLIVSDRLGTFGTKSSLEKRKPAFSPAVHSFASLGISTQLQGALKSMSIKAPTEVQSACIPPLLAGKDCIGNAKTGSGKTIAFALPILQKLAVDPYGIYALVLTPTRELAFQISEQFAVLGNSFNIRTAVIVGGMDMMAQSIELGNRPHVVIATPGRIVDHLRSSADEWDLSRVKFLVLDEADRLLTSTFTPELSYLFNVLPKERQTCLFTATLTPAIEQLADAPPRPGKQKPFIHRMKEIVETVSTLKQHYILVPSHVREAYLYYLLCNPPESTIALRRAQPEPVKHGKHGKPKPKAKKAKIDHAEEEPEQPPPTIIFCAKPKTAAYLTLLLKTLLIRSTALHSRLTQKERLSSLQLFRASVVPVLISTDVGARGLDIEDVALVINWDLPQEPEEYTHRVGRTARAGKGGIAISFVTERDEERVLKIEDRIKTKLEEITLPEDKVLRKLNAVSTAKRLANMELHDSNFGKREEIQQIKNAKSRNFAEGEKGSRL
ncbi:DEAD-domain-containing protein [Pholiota conissans]|uniref:DEAD-domain-containing protein n=1 Tax=Pholiota conissans TaxID=109636 RepID=A0A9P5Z7V0_9AGAR|nr:DEAD-domain-containing protein [Pholiota conissans]